MADLIDQWSQDAPAQPIAPAAPAVAPIQSRGAAPDLIDQWGGQTSSLTYSAQAPRYSHDAAGNTITLPPRSDQEEAEVRANQQPLPIAHPETLDDWVNVAETGLTAPMRALEGVPAAVGRDFTAAKNL